MSPKRFTVHDQYFWKAKKQGLRARSAFKLEEIQKRFPFVQSGDTVIDLGAAPGGFLQFLSQWVGSHGMVIGLDLSPIAPIASNVRTFVQDIFAFDGVRQCLTTCGIIQCQVVTSDLAPKTTGIKEIDHERSLELNRHAFQFAKEFLNPGGHVLFKIFRGPDFDYFLKTVRQHFRIVRCIKPQASRDRSREIYILGLHFHKP